MLGFCLFLRPDSLLSVVWARVAVIDGEPTFQYKPLSWKGRIAARENTPVLQFPLGSLPFLREAMLQRLAVSPSSLTHAVSPVYVGSEALDRLSFVPQ